MEADNCRRPGDLLPGDRVVEKLLPEDHVGRKKVGFEGSEEVEGEISDHQKDNNHRHRADDGADGILDEGRATTPMTTRRRQDMGRAEGVLSLKVPILP